MKQQTTALLLLLLCTSAYSEYPRIGTLSREDILFRQLQDDISAFNRSSARGTPPPPLMMYEYVSRGEDLFSLAARLNMPYETLATLNGLENPAGFSPGTSILIPSLPGIFIPADPQSDLDHLMVSWRDRSGTQEVVLMSGENRKRFLFLQDMRFHPLERAYFLGVLFRFPLPRRNISSSFGSRVHPISGKLHFHKGIDLAAERGTEVYAAAAGIVTETGYDNVYGRYVLISHFGGYETLYGHLDQVLIQLKKEVLAGSTIGTVGSTGLSTGPHLHFEIRSGNGLRNPEMLLPKGKEGT